MATNHTLLGRFKFCPVDGGTLFPSREHKDQLTCLEEHGILTTNDKKGLYKTKLILNYVRSEKETNPPIPRIDMRGAMELMKHCPICGAVMTAPEHTVFVNWCQKHLATYIDGLFKAENLFFAIDVL